MLQTGVVSFSDSEGHGILWVLCTAMIEGLFVVDAMSEGVGVGRVCSWVRGGHKMGVDKRIVIGVHLSTRRKGYRSMLYEGWGLGFVPERRGGVHGRGTR